MAHQSPCSAAEALRDAVDQTIEQGVFETASSVLVHDTPTSGGASKGYCDISASLVASQWTIDPDADIEDEVLQYPSFFHDKLLYQLIPTDPPEWMGLNVHGLGATELVALFWLRGAVTVDYRDELPATGGRGHEVSVALDFAEAVHNSPPEVAISLQMDDLANVGEVHGGARGTVIISDRGLISHIELTIGSDPETLVTLTLEPTGRRHVELPHTSSQMSAAAFVAQFTTNNAD